MLGRPYGRRSPEAFDVEVRVDGRYEPDVLRVPAGLPVRIAFRREETASCSERVVFPSLGLNVALPAHEQVVVDLPAQQPGEVEFTCRLGVLRGRLILESWFSTDGDHPR